MSNQEMPLSQFINEISETNDCHSCDKIEVLVPIDNQPGRYRSYAVDRVGVVPGVCASVVLKTRDKNLSFVRLAPEQENNVG
jgi:hypothetical protein